MSDDQENALVDITSLIEACAASLNYSNPMLCNEETFSLHDSMAALELMDRKMDCCDLSAALIHPNNDPTLLMPPRNIPTGLDDELVPLPWNELTVHDASSIGLEILSRLESLLSGASVAESTYTCLYAHNAVLIDMKERLWTQQFDSMNILLEESQDSNIPQFLVYATTLALVEISDVIRSIVMHADIYEEEDFSINTFGIQFFPDADRPRIIKTIEEARKRLSKLRDEEYSSDVIIMDHILEFQLLFLQICSSLAKLSTTPALDVTKEAQLMSREGVKVLNKIMSLLDEQPNPTRSNDILNRCFDPFVYRPLVGSAPVRKVSMHSPRESLPILSKLLSEVDWAVCKLLLEGSTLLQIRQMLNRASLSSVNILSRSLIVLNLYFDDKLLGRHPLASLIGSDVAQLMHLPKALLDSIHGQAFLGRLCKPIYDALKLLVFNRNRQRVYMESIMFYDWSVLQQEASVVDMHHRQEHGVELPSYFTYYAIYFMSWLMDYYVALGIELRLYCGHHDLAVAFWYRDFLLSSLLSTMASIRAAKKESEETNDSLEDIEVMIVGFKRILCRGIVRFIAVLNQANMLDPEIFEFTSHQQRFQKQFEPFQQIVSPPPLSYDDFQAGLDYKNVTQADLISYTTDCFKESKSILDSISSHLKLTEPQSSTLSADEIKALTKVCVGNSVFLMRLIQHIRSNETSNCRVTFDFCANSQFCTVKIE